MSAGPGRELIPVLFVLPCLGTGGSERVVMNLCLEMQDEFLPVVVAFRDGELAAQLRGSGVVVHVLNRRGGIDLRLTFSLLKLIRKYQIRVINTHHFVSLFYAFWASRFAGVPIVHTEHSRWEMENLSRFWKLWFRLFLSRLEMVTAVSRGAFEYLIDHLSSDKKRTTLVLNGIDVELFKKGAEQPVLRHELGLADDDLVVGCVGNLRVEKNQELLIRALALLQGQDRNVKVLLIGDGPSRSFLENLTQELGVEDKVLFLGIRHDVPRLYGVMDVYCLPSRYEGLPLTLLEAMAAGTPIVGTDVLGISEVIQHRQNGLLVADNDPEKLKDALITLEQNLALRTALAESGRTRVDAAYSFAAFVSGYKLLFMQMTQGCSDAEN